MAPSFSRVSSGALLLALAYSAQPVKADFSEDVDNCELVLKDMPVDLTTEYCNGWTSGYQPEEEYTTVTGYPVTITEYPDAKTCDDGDYAKSTKEGYPASTPEPPKGYETGKPTWEDSKPHMGHNETTKVCNSVLLLVKIRPNKCRLPICLTQPICLRANGTSL